MTGRAAAFVATLRYEALLGLRRRVTWLALLPLFALITLLCRFPHGRNTTHEVAAIGDAALLIGFLGSIGIAVTLADRLTAQREPGLRELFGTTSGHGWTRSMGVVVGPWLVASVPGAILLVAMGGWLAVRTGGLAPLTAAVIGLVAVVLPGSLLLTALTNLVGLLLSSTVARVLVVPFWYWATALSPLIPVPTVTKTVLSPLGDYQAALWLDVALPAQGGSWLRPEVCAAGAFVALGFTLSTTLLIFGIGHLILTKNR